MNNSNQEAMNYLGSSVFCMNNSNQEANNLILQNDIGYAFEDITANNGAAEESGGKIGDKKRRRNPEKRNSDEKKRRQNFNAHLEVLHEIIPNSHKKDKASTLLDAISYIMELRYELFQRVKVKVQRRSLMGDISPPFQYSPAVQTFNNYDLPSLGHEMGPIISPQFQYSPPVRFSNNYDLPSLGHEMGPIISPQFQYSPMVQISNNYDLPSLGHEMGMGLMNYPANQFDPSSAMGMNYPANELELSNASFFDSSSITPGTIDDVGIDVSQPFHSTNQDFLWGDSGYPQWGWGDSGYPQ